MSDSDPEIRGQFTRYAVHAVVEGDVRGRHVVAEVRDAGRRGWGASRPTAPAPRGESLGRRVALSRRGDEPEKESEEECRRLLTGDVDNSCHDDDSGGDAGDQREEEPDIYFEEFGERATASARRPGTRPRGRAIRPGVMAVTALMSRS